MAILLESYIQRCSGDTDVMMEDMRTIYSKLNDDLSKQIYLCRFNYSISEDDRHIDKLVDISVRTSNLWRKLRADSELINGEKLVLFGNGIWGDTIFNEFRHLNWECIIDNSPTAEEKNGIPIVQADAFFTHYEKVRIVISSYKNRREMVEQCIKAGVREADIIDVSSVIYELTEGRIYFDNTVPMRLNDGVFVDGGCFDGSDTKRFLEHHQGTALCFEPDERNIDRIREKLSDCEKGRYRIIPKGLWSESGRLSFLSDGNVGSHVDITAQGAEKVEVGTIDAEVGKSKVSMIKMDIEGAELEALKGAQNIIRKDRPVLAISVYHKPEDIVEIPKYILSLHDGYRLFMRHYSFSWYDTVLYAVPEE